MPSYLVKVRKKMSIYAQRRARGVFAGNYGSVFKGRSMDFDDLREYNYGDDVKDIDWNATARSRNIMIRRYIAIRKHNIMIVADNSRAMAALAPSGETKADVAAFCAGTLAYIAMKHGDLVGLVAGNRENTMRFPVKEDGAYIENFLDKYYKSVKIDSPGADINAVLNYITKSFRERMFLIVITDPASALTINHSTVRKLSARHEQMFCIVEDAPVTSQLLLGGEARDIEKNVRIPRFFRADADLARSEASYREAQRQVISRTLHHYGIVSCFVDGTDQAIPQIIRMLEEQKHARRK